MSNIKKYIGTKNEWLRSLIWTICWISLNLAWYHTLIPRYLDNVNAGGESNIFLTIIIGLMPTMMNWVTLKFSIYPWMNKKNILPVDKESVERGYER